MCGVLFELRESGEATRDVGVLRQTSVPGCRQPIPTTSSLSSSFPRPVARLANTDTRTVVLLPSGDSTLPTLSALLASTFEVLATISEILPTSAEVVRPIPEVLD